MAPVIPHPIAITLLDSSSVEVDEGTVAVRNVTKATVSDDVTTNANGNAIIDLANLPLGSGQTVPYETGDSILISGTDGTDTDVVSYTVAGHSKSQTLTLDTRDQSDVIEDMVSLFEDNWAPSLTDNILPIFTKITTLKNVGYTNDDHILFYETTPEEITAFSLGLATWDHKNFVSCDIRTTFKKAKIEDISVHIENMKKEFERILKANTTGYLTYDWIMPLRRRDLSDKSIGIFRYVYDINPRRILSN